MDKMINKVFIKQILFSLMTSLIVTLQTVNSHALKAVSSTGFQVALRDFFDASGVYINIFIGFVLLQNILIFIYHLVRLGGVSTNPEKRAKCIQDLMISGVCLALIGGSTVCIYLLVSIGL